MANKRGNPDVDHLKKTQQMSHTVRSYNTLLTYSCFPLEFKHEDKLIVFSRMYAFRGQQFRTRCDIIDLEIISVPDHLTEQEKDRCRDFQLFHN